MTEPKMPPVIVRDLRGRFGVGGLGLSDFFHGLLEVSIEDFGEEVDGVAAEFSFRPSPVTFFDQNPRMFFDGIVACVEREQIESPRDQ